MEYRDLEPYDREWDKYFDNRPRCLWCGELIEDADDTYPSHDERYCARCREGFERSEKILAELRK